MNPFKIPHIKAYFRKNDVHLNNQALKYCVITAQYLEIELDGITACSPLFLNQKIAVFLGRAALHNSALFCTLFCYECECTNNL